MRIAIINGSPKGENSVTLQNTRYMFKRHSEVQLEVYNVAQQIHRLEKDIEYFETTLTNMASADAVIWSFPVYVFTVPSQLKRFIEMVFERNFEKSFNLKYTCLVLSSIHFYDHCAVNYMNAICDDLKMKYVDFLSVHMRDLTKEAGRDYVKTFGNRFLRAVEDQKVTQVNHAPLTKPNLNYVPSILEKTVSFADKKALLVVDDLEDQTLKAMVDQCLHISGHTFEIINLSKLDIKGGCIGCIKCGHNYECRYKGKDDFIAFYDEKIKGAEVILFAGTIKDRYLSSKWKQYLDRAFFNTHTPTLMNKHVGFIISGPLRAIPNLKQTLEAYFQWQKCHNSGYVSNEYETSDELDQQLLSLMHNILSASESKLKANETFLSVSTHKLFRDEMWGHLRFPFRADYKAYKAMHLFDFPQKNVKSRVYNRIMSILMLIPKVRSEIYTNQMIPAMVKQHKKIVNDPEL
ncbi:NAD(P)H-dependent oxidoreductase [Fusibacter ferrireducens]|uniref:NAD(P)H-dependent oxidoreductase n=1 Tax=Fusibacter ferrireducens TaxID=2785058 RepID=A0ABR9ZNC8_9FIRM|nr:NAD(P)H-dependent oxidoreductase [Fusibacter ferrireducens]MBF4691821.1 NAD(P)H-dependent oxidoreductase [Fusibacter ferrireducens]